VSAGQITQGRRVQPNPDGTFHLERGDYVKAPMADGSFRWFARVPDEGMNDMDMSDLTNHSPVEHEDGTATFSPSIGHHGHTPDWKERYWHGYLEHGVWREA